MGDDERRAPRHHLAQRRLDGLLRRRVDRGRRVVEDEDARVGEQRPGDRDALALAAGEREAALADARVVAVGQLGHEAGGLGALGGALDLRAGGVRAAVGDVVVDGGAEQERVVGDHRDGAAQRGEVDLPHVGAVDAHRAGRDVVEAGEELHERRLAGARPAHEGHGRPRLHDEVDVAQRGPGRLRVAEGDAGELHPAAPRRQRRRARRAHDPRRAVEQLEQPRARGRRALGHPQRDAELAHRPDQHQQVRVEGGEVAERERPGDDLAPAGQEDHREPHARQEADERVVVGAQPGRRHGLVEDAADRPLEGGELARLGREGLHHAHAGDVLLHVRGQLGDALLDLLQRRPRAVPVAGGDQHDDRHRRQRQGGQPGLQGEHGRGGQHDGERALGDEDEPVAEEEPHGLQVDRGARHQLAGLLGVEEPQLERLEVAVHEVAQVDLDGQRHAPGDQPARHGQREPRQGDEHDGAGQEPQRPLVAGAHVVDRLARQPRNGHRGDHGERRERQRPGRACSVGPEKAQQAQEGAHATNDRRNGSAGSTLRRARPGASGAAAERRAARSVSSRRR